MVHFDDLTVAVSGENRETASVVYVGDALVDGRAVCRAEGTYRWFYIINAEDDDEARAWARRVAEATNHSIEVRPFAATGLVKDLAM